MTADLVSKSDVVKVYKYIFNQPEHHRKVSFQEVSRRGFPYDKIIGLDRRLSETPMYNRNRKFKNSKETKIHDFDFASFKSKSQQTSGFPVCFFKSVNLKTENPDEAISLGRETPLRHRI